MSNSAAKKLRRRAKFEEDDLLYIHDVSPIKLKNIPSVEQEKEKKVKEKKATKKEPTEVALSSVAVKCDCNKCKSPVEGTLIGILFSPIPNLNIPFISYFCSYCKHQGKRSVMSRALPPDEFDRIYF